MRLDRRGDRLLRRQPGGHRVVHRVSTVRVKSDFEPLRPSASLRHITTRDSAAVRADGTSSRPDPVPESSNTIVSPRRPQSARLARRPRRRPNPSETLVPALRDAQCGPASLVVAVDRAVARCRGLTGRWLSLAVASFRNAARGRTPSRRGLGRMGGSSRTTRAHTTRSCPAARAHTAAWSRVGARCSCSHRPGMGAAVGLRRPDAGYLPAWAVGRRTIRAVIRTGEGAW